MTQTIYKIKIGDSKEVDIDKHVTYSYSDHCRYIFAYDYYYSQGDYEKADLLRWLFDRFGMKLSVEKFNNTITLEDKTPSDRSREAINEPSVKVTEYPSLQQPDRLDVQEKVDLAIKYIQDAYNEMCRQLDN